MSRHKVEISGVNTANIKVLTNNEQVELFKKLKNGDPFAKEDLINGNLKLVLSLLRKFNNRTDNMDDLFQVGCIGLIKAIDNFDLGHEVKFSTYAVPMILGEVKRYLRDNNSMRIARSIKDTAYRSLRIKEELTNKFGREATAKEIADVLGVSEFEVVNAMDAIKETISMSEQVFNDGGEAIYISDQIQDKTYNNYPLELRIALKDAITKLKDKEKLILTERYIIGKTQMELAEEMGISQAQISRLEKSGLENIKKMIN
jgi:RNA polymerase sporulation-specific sigma factor